MNLHDLPAPYVTVAQLWGNLYSSRQYRQLFFRDGYTHSFPISRNSTRALYDIGNHYRYGWRPWQHNQYYDPVGELTTTCGIRVRSQSRARGVRLRLAVAYGQRCPTCTSLGGTDYQTVAAEDPWNQMSQNERNENPDPVTGQ